MQTLHSLSRSITAAAHKCSAASTSFGCWISGAGRVFTPPLCICPFLDFYRGINFLCTSRQPLSNPQAEQCRVSASIVCIINQHAVNEDRGVIRLWGLSYIISGLCKIEPSLLFIHAPTCSLLFIFFFKNVLLMEWAFTVGTKGTTWHASPVFRACY